MDNTAVDLTKERGFDNKISSTLQGQAYGITADAEFFHHLSSKIYTDSKLAIVREITCNGIDSHKDAGNDAPVEIHLPTAFDPKLVIVDHGLGMDLNTMMDVYANYGKSTKRDNLNVTGGLGVGSKTPFSYGDGFTVTSVKDGQKHVMINFKDNGIPKIKEILTSDTDEPNGLKVEIPIRTEDFDYFEKCALFMRTVSDFPVVIHNAKYDDYKDAHVNDERGVFQVTEDVKFDNVKFIDYKSKGLIDRITDGYYFVSMGNVLYSLDVSKFDIEFKQKLQNLDEAQHLFYDCPDNNYRASSVVVFNFPVGSLDFSMSREHLDYSDRTIENFKKQVQPIFDKVSEVIDQYVQDHSENEVQEYRTYKKLESKSGIKTFYENKDNRGKNGRKSLLKVATIRKSNGLGKVMTDFHDRFSSISYNPDNHLYVKYDEEFTGKDDKLHINILYTELRTGFKDAINHWLNDYKWKQQHCLSSSVPMLFTKSAKTADALERKFKFLTKDIADEVVINKILVDDYLPEVEKTARMSKATKTADRKYGLDVKTDKYQSEYDFLNTRRGVYVPNKLSRAECEKLGWDYKAYADNDFRFLNTIMKDAGQHVKFVKVARSMSKKFERADNWMSFDDYLVMCREYFIDAATYYVEENYLDVYMIEGNEWRGFYKHKENMFVDLDKLCYAMDDYKELMGDYPQLKIGISPLIVEADPYGGRGINKRTLVRKYGDGNRRYNDDTYTELDLFTSTFNAYFKGDERKGQRLSMREIVNANTKIQGLVNYYGLALKLQTKAIKAAVRNHPITLQRRKVNLEKRRLHFMIKQQQKVLAK